jgi:DNA-binding transcriptional MerR regulator
MRDANGYRLYPQESVGRVRTVRRSVALGFSLAELSRIFVERDRGGIPCRKVRALAEEKLRGVEESLTELRRLRVRLREILRDWDQRLEQSGKGRRALLLESLEQVPEARKDKAFQKGFGK